jgi:proteasome lid subunit RPN8/RPN11
MVDHDGAGVFGANVGAGVEVRMDKINYLRMIGWCLDKWPEEACGLIGEMPSGLMGVWPGNNVAEDPSHEFCVDPDLQRRLLANGFPLQGTFHSHPRTGPVPSDLDRGMYYGLMEFADDGGELIHLIVSLKGGQPKVCAWKVWPGRFGGLVQVAFSIGDLCVRKVDDAQTT